MLKNPSILDDVRVASPCAASWEEMAGTNRVRFCRHCQKNVYNLSAMSRGEAEAFVREREVRTCIQFYQRADGTMLTDDCPVGLRIVRGAARRSWALLAGSLVAGLGLIVGAAAFSLAKRPGALRNVEPFASILDWIDPAPPAVPLATPMTPTLPPDPIDIEPDPAEGRLLRGDMCIPDRPRPIRSVPSSQPDSKQDGR